VAAFGAGLRDDGRGAPGSLLAPARGQEQVDPSGRAAAEVMGLRFVLFDEGDGGADFRAHLRIAVRSAHARAGERDARSAGTPGTAACGQSLDVKRARIEPVAFFRAKVRSFISQRQRDCFASGSGAGGLLPTVERVGDSGGAVGESRGRYGSPPGPRRPA